MEKGRHPIFVSYEKSLDFLLALGSYPFGYRIEAEQDRHRLLAIDDMREPLWEFRLPLPLPALPNERQDWKEYILTLSPEMPSYVLLLVQLGAASMGYFEEGEIYAHKSFKKYMKRHKRGKAQISYLNTRGKSKAGSRVRLANTVRFFEEINERLNEWEADYGIERILYSCSAQVWGLLFQSQVSPPFQKKDARLRKVPLDVNIPKHEELLRISPIIQQGRLLIHQDESFPAELLPEEEEESRVG